MCFRNTKAELFKWMQSVLDSCELDVMAQANLFNIAKKVIDNGGLRGDVSEEWVRAGYGHDDLKDLYL